jgi:DNA/RNA-binding domain of Phe-tRNA-synthetase-like protein
VHIAIATALRPVLRLGVLVFDGLTVVERDARLDPLLAAAEGRARSHAPPDAAHVRRMYRRVGLDPTRRRPSSEALLRRVVRGEPLPRINSIVDVCNWCSLEFQLPYGLYDLARVTGGVELRLGRDGESYAGIRKDDVHVDGRITLADDVGAFGNPTSDSARTMVTTATTNAMMVIFAPIEIARERVAEVVAVSAERTLSCCGGTLLESSVV